MQVKQTSQIEDSRTPIQKMRRRDVSARLFAHGIDHHPGLPKNVLVSMAQVRDIDLEKDLIEKPVEPEIVETAKPVEQDPRKMRIMNLRQYVRDTKGVAWKHTQGLKKEELLRILDG